MHLSRPGHPTRESACAAGSLVAAGLDGAADRPLRLVDGLLYLGRYWRQEQLVRVELDTRAGRQLGPVDPTRLRVALDRLLGR